MATRLAAAPTMGLLRIGAALLLGFSGCLHAELYIHGYRVIPEIGPTFLLQASGSFAVAVLLLGSGRAIPRLGAAALAGGALVGFVLSRTVGVFGFIERGFNPAPEALFSVLAEVGTLVLLAIPLALRGLSKCRVVVSRWRLTPRSRG
jgi:hypothetical protein